MMGNSDGLSATQSEWSIYPNHPVESISWEMVQVFLKILNNQDSDHISLGWEYVIPTEAQWEYACRAGTSTVYSWGDNFSATDARHGIFLGYSDSVISAPYVEVGGYNPNPWGFHDMHGNVWEWTADAYHEYTAAARTDPFNAVVSGFGSSSYPVIRGGSWGNSDKTLRSAVRGQSPQDYQSNKIGFRLAFRQTNFSAPVITSASTYTVSENERTIGTITATDEDGDRLTYSITDGVDASSY